MLRLRLASHSQSPAFAQHDRSYFGMTRFGHCAFLACTLIVAMGAAALGQAGAGQKNPPSTGIETALEKEPDKPTSAENYNNGIVIDPAELPGTYPQGAHQSILQA